MRTAVWMVLGVSIGMRTCRDGMEEVRGGGEEDMVMEQKEVRASKWEGSDDDDEEERQGTEEGTEGRASSVLLLRLFR